MSEELIRTELLIGADAVNTLADSRVLVFGVGGVGGYVCEALARSGVGHIDIVDDDTVALSNINRQIIATHSTVGRYKTEVMVERIKDINPYCEVNEYRCFYLPENKDQFDFTKYDYIIDAIDTITAKLTIVEEAKKAGTMVISSMGAGNKLNPAAFTVADISKTSVDRLARVMRRELKKRGIYHLKVVYSTEQAIEPKNNPDEAASVSGTDFSDSDMSAGPVHKKRATPGSIAFVPSVVGLIIAGEVIKDLTGINR